MFQKLKREKKKKPDTGNVLLFSLTPVFHFLKVTVSEGFLPAILPCVPIYSLAD